MGELFGTDGIRGEAGIYPITSEVAVDVGRALAVALQHQGQPAPQVVIGRDTRESGEMLESGLTEGLNEAGADVLLAGVMPTPAVSFLTKAMSADAGVVLTASHNPYTDNGIKIFDQDGLKLSDDLEDHIEQLIVDPPTEISAAHAGHGSIREVGNGEMQYIDFAKKTVHGQKLDRLKVVLDCANGAPYRVAPVILRDLGAEVTVRAVKPDGRNINRKCGALHPNAAGKLVKREGADIGISLDGDGDRVILTDAKGNVVDGDRILVMCALDLQERGLLKDNTLVVTAMSNLGLHEIMAENGITVETTEVGDRHVGERMREGGYNLGGEKSGHIIFLDYATAGDGIVTALQVMRLMKQSRKTLKSLAGRMREYPQQLVGIPVRDKPPFEELPEFSKALRKCEKKLGTDGRVVVRYSGTEQKLRLLVESKDPDAVEHWVTTLSEIVQKEIGQ